MHDRRGGFTLIELLVVIAIIALTAQPPYAASFSSYTYRCAVERAAGNDIGNTPVLAAENADLAAVADWFRPAGTYPEDIMMHAGGFHAAYYNGSARFFPAPGFVYEGTAYVESDFPHIAFFIADDP